FALCAGEKGDLLTEVENVSLVDDVEFSPASGTGSRLVFDSYAAPGVMCAALLQAMTDADPERTQARLEDYEQVADEHHFFLRD
ncbi:MurR/RpiR family transcriptional regulator, partial [Streptomyces werraensis]